MFLECQNLVAIRIEGHSSPEIARIPKQRDAKVFIHVVIPVLVDQLRHQVRTHQEIERDQFLATGALLLELAHGGESPRFGPISFSTNV